MGGVDGGIPARCGGCAITMAGAAALESVMAVAGGLREVGVFMRLIVLDGLIDRFVSGFVGKLARRFVSGGAGVEVDGIG